MQKKILFKFILILMFLIQIDIPMAYAEGSSGLEVYNTGISDGTIDPSLSFEDYEAIYNSINSPEKSVSTLPSNKMLSTLSVPTISYTIKKGDIIITNGTSYNGLTGHAAIAAEDN